MYDLLVDTKRSRVKIAHNPNPHENAPIHVVMVTLKKFEVRYCILYDTINLVLSDFSICDNSFTLYAIPMNYTSLYVLLLTASPDILPILILKLSTLVI